MKVQLKNGIHINGITPDNLYTVIGLDDQYYRIVNDRREPIIYERENFIVIDAFLPSSWIRKEFEDGDYYLGPPELSSAGFFEDYFDHKSDACKRFNRFLRLNGMRALMKIKS
jgi:hypothetical protein